MTGGSPRCISQQMARVFFEYSKILVLWRVEDLGLRDALVAPPHVSSTRRSVRNLKQKQNEALKNHTPNILRFLIIKLKCRVSISNNSRF